MGNTHGKTIPPTDTLATDRACAVACRTDEAPSGHGWAVGRLYRSWTSSIIHANCNQ